MRYLSPLLSDARASIGGATASKNRAGNYFRARIAPVQPRTPAQQTVRANLSAFAASWRGLTASQIAGWNALAKSITKKSSLGQSYNPSGEQLYVGNNQVLANSELGPVTDPPTSAFTFEALGAIDAVAAAGAATFTVATGLAAAPTGVVFALWATPQLSAGISFFGKSARRYVANYPAADYASINIKAAYVALFGALVAGSAIEVGVTMLDTTSGFQSQIITERIIVAA